MKSLFLPRMIARCWLLSILLLISTSMFSKDISPFDYGLRSARDGVERFNVLYKAHADAVAKGVSVDYSGIGKIELVVPKSAKSIPLSEYTDFKGTEFYVKNTEKDIYLFSLVTKSETINVEKQYLARALTFIPVLAGKDVLLSIEDANLWVEKRSGYSYGATRKDLVVINNGQMQNIPIMTYNNTSSSPKCHAYPYRTNRKIIRGIRLSRSPDSSKKTFLLKVEGQYNLSISDVTIVTPKNALNADSAINIINSASVSFKNIRIEGTYSQKDKYGYGIAMNNVYDVSFDQLYAYGDWGVFGTNNAQDIRLKKSDINRFDIHCYGRDITFKKCVFRNLYNQFSSVYGTVRFVQCSFIDSVPVLLEYSYNAYTGFDLVFEKCYLKVSEASGKNCIVNVGYLNDEKNSRAELEEKCWPNVRIDGMQIDLPPSVNKVYLMNLRKKVSYTNALGYASEFSLNKITVNGNKKGKPVELQLSNYEIPIDHKIRVTQKRNTHPNLSIKDNISIKR